MIERQFILWLTNGNPEHSDVAPKRCIKHLQNKLIKKPNIISVTARNMYMFMQYWFWKDFPIYKFYIV